MHNLYDWRIAQGLSQEKAARALDISLSTFIRWEKYGVPLLKQAYVRVLVERTQKGERA